MDVGEHWKFNSQNIEVIQKKRIFFRTLGPLVLRANEKILADRERLLALQAKDDAGGEDATWLTKLAQRYKVEGADAVALAELVKRVDAVPPSLVLRSEEHTSELQSLMRISYAVFCLKKKTTERLDQTET